MLISVYSFNSEENVFKPSSAQKTYFNLKKKKIGASSYSDSEKEKGDDKMDEKEKTENQQPIP